MEFLREFGFNEKEIQEIIEKNSKNVIENLKINKENVEDIIEYLIGIGMQKDTIKEMFWYQVGLFFKTLNEIKESFDEYEIDSIVKSLNYDVNNVELIDFI